VFHDLEDKMQKNNDLSLMIKDEMQNHIGATDKIYNYIINEA
jgi:hypothetical protein